MGHPEASFGLFEAGGVGQGGDGELLGFDEVQSHHLAKLGPPELRGLVEDLRVELQVNLQVLPQVPTAVGGKEGFGGIPTGNGGRDVFLLSVA
jgi:hypothetical protein